MDKRRRAKVEREVVAMEAELASRQTTTRRPRLSSLPTPYTVPQPQPKPRAGLPAAGVVRGGRLDDWRYTYQRYVVGADGALLMDATITPPNWPFPRRLLMRAGRDYTALEPLAHVHAQLLDDDRQREIARELHALALQMARYSPT